MLTQTGNGIIQCGEGRRAGRIRGEIRAIEIENICYASGNDIGKLARQGIAVDWLCNCRHLSVIFPYDCRLLLRRKIRE